MAFSCCTPKLQNNLKANHNRDSELPVPGRVVVRLSYRII